MWPVSVLFSTVSFYNWKVLANNYPIQEQAIMHSSRNHIEIEESLPIQKNNVDTVETGAAGDTTENSTGSREIIITIETVEG